MGVNDRADDIKADKRAKAKEKAAQRVEWRGFVNIELTAADKVAFREWLEGVDTSWDYLVERVTEGYKLTISFDHTHDAWVSSLTCNRSSDKNAGLCLTARGGNTQLALQALVYKDYVMLKGVWSGHEAHTGGKFAADDVG